jgi:hypothetical protein
MEAKQCKQCGEIRPISEFRRYYGGLNGTYTRCKSCEKINSRVKYLERKGDKATEADKAELDKLHQIYELQRMCGYNPPQRRVAHSDRLDAIIGSLSNKAAERAEVPTELTRWLTEELTDVPEYYLDSVYADLRRKYMPIKRVDPETMLPVYDDSYAHVLEQILDRFNEYEDKYYQ